MALSRLEKIEEQQSVKKAVRLAAITVGAIVLAMVVGIPLLIKLAVWWGDVVAARQPAEKTDLIPPVPPKIILAYEATNSAVQNIEGFSEPESVVALGQNGKPIGNTTTDAGGRWQFEKITLNEGVNTFFAVAVDEAGNKSAQSEIISMRFQSKLPELVVDSPTDRQLVTGKTGNVEVRGSTIQNGRLTVNDRVIILNSGKFATNFLLSEGENVLVFVVTDPSGNQTKKELVVEYRK